jgi:hypothetical protein
MFTDRTTEVLLRTNRACAGNRMTSVQFVASWDVQERGRDGLITQWR